MTEDIGQETPEPQEITCSGGIKLDFGALFGDREAAGAAGQEEGSE